MSLTVTLNHSECSSHVLEQSSLESSENMMRVNTRLLTERLGDRKLASEPFHMLIPNAEPVKAANNTEIKGIIPIVIVVGMHNLNKCMLKQSSTYELNKSNYIRSNFLKSTKLGNANTLQTQCKYSLT